MGYAAYSFAGNWEALCDFVSLVEDLISKLARRAFSSGISLSLTVSVQEGLKINIILNRKIS